MFQRSAPDMIRTRVCTGVSKGDPIRVFTSAALVHNHRLAASGRRDSSQKSARVCAPFQENADYGRLRVLREVLDQGVKLQVHPISDPDPFRDSQAFIVCSPLERKPDATALTEK